MTNDVTESRTTQLRTQKTMSLVLWCVIGVEKRWFVGAWKVAYDTRVGMGKAGTIDWNPRMQLVVIKSSWVSPDFDGTCGCLMAVTPFGGLRLLLIFEKNCGTPPLGGMLVPY